MTLIAIHLLQNHAPSNLNRDDNGDPKDALFGGVRRARISSQALKRSMRWDDSFRKAFESKDLLARRSKLTLHIIEYLKKTNQFESLTEEEVSILSQQANKLGKATSQREAEAAEEMDNTEKGDSSKAQLMFLTDAEVQDVAEHFLTLRSQQFDVKRGKKQLRVSFAGLTADELRERLPQYEPHAVDIAAFGRMTTSSPFKNVEASVQVAHALSTHAVEQEFDFYTAVDDISGETGAGFIGEVSFNSATYYKYINIDWGGLVKNLQGDTAVAAATVRAIIRAAIFAIPSGKQNSFAAHNLPDLALVEVRTAQVALSYANAFVKPVRASAQKSLVDASAEELQNYIPTINDMYGLAAERAFLSTVPFALPEATQFANLDDLLKWLPLGD